MAAVEVIATLDPKWDKHLSTSKLAIMNWKKALPFFWKLLKKRLDSCYSNIDVKVNMLFLGIINN